MRRQPCQVCETIGPDNFPVPLEPARHWWSHYPPKASLWFCTASCLEHWLRVTRISA